MRKHHPIRRLPLNASIIIRLPVFIFLLVGEQALLLEPSDRVGLAVIPVLERETARILGGCELTHGYEVISLNHFP